jgi:hypothetical protein
MTKRMTYEEFIDFVKSECVLETIYKDSEGRLILVIELLDAYVMVNKAKRPWVGLTEEEVSKLIDQEIGFNSCWGPEEAFAAAIEAKLKEKNT